MIPTKTKDLIKKVFASGKQLDVLAKIPVRVGIPVEPGSLEDAIQTAKEYNKVQKESPSVTDHIVAAEPVRLRGPWKVAPAPEPENVRPDILYRLTVAKNKTWKIDATDLLSGRSWNYCSGVKAPLSMSGQVYTGKELKEMQCQ